MGDELGILERRGHGAAGEGRGRRGFGRRSGSSRSRHGGASLSIP